MNSVDRRVVLSGGVALLSIGMSQVAQGQAKPKLRFSCAFPETDLRAEGYKAFAAAMKDEFDFEPYWSNTLFKQGTELVALQRDNLELCNLAPADISKQIPAWSLLTSAYLFRDYDHLKKTFASDVGQDFIKLARDQLGIEVIRPVYFGARQVNLKPTKKINTPADMAGIKLRMPPGEFWQFLGESLGANPTPVAYAELYTALQTGAVDGQDNPLVSGRTMKFYEVTSQFVLTSHVIGYDMLSVSKKSWDGTERCQAGQVPRRGRQGVRRERGEVRRAREGSDRVLQEGRQAGLHARPERLPRLRAEEVPRQIRQRLAEGRDREDQRHQVEPQPRSRSPAVN